MGKILTTYAPKTHLGGHAGIELPTVYLSHLIAFSRNLRLKVFTNLHDFQLQKY